MSDYVRDLHAEVDSLRAALEQVFIAGNHIATYRSDRWPDYPLDGLTRDQQCEHALRTLGAGRDYDMWCCWSSMMQVRDSLPHPDAEHALQAHDVL